MNNAINAVRSDGYGYLKASLMYNVPKSTLERRVKRKNKYVKGDLISWVRYGCGVCGGGGGGCSH